MRSRFFVGVVAWMLGAISATAGSLYAVDQLGQDLLVQQSKQVSVAMVNSELALENSEHATPTPKTSSPARRARVHKKAKPAPSPTPTPATDPGTLLTSADGSAVASCQQDLASLVYVTPYNGFEADHIINGPAQVVSVIFRGPSSGIIMRIWCDAGQPRAHVSPLDDRRPGYDE